MAFKNLFLLGLIGIISGFVLVISAKTNIINPPACTMMGLTAVIAFVVLGSLINGSKKIAIPSIFLISGMMVGAIGAEFALKISIFCICVGLFYALAPN